MTELIVPDKSEYQVNIFLISPRGTSKEYSQHIHVFSCRNKKIAMLITTDKKKKKKKAAFWDLGPVVQN